ncbi:MAG TPA: ATP-binding protein [Bacteroidales bacterium]|nr:ATP-binding protein [Bacteroidales bacterium]
MFVYFSTYFLVKKFIYNKIRTIYKTINTFHSKEGAHLALLKNKGDLLQQVNTDVINWAKSHDDEIMRLKEMETYRREFLGNVSHELKTPIFNIQGYILTLLEGGIYDAEINIKYLQRAEQSINRLISIVEDLETIASLESGGYKLNLSKFNIVDLCYEVANLFEIKAASKKIKIIINKEGSKTINVIADKEKISQVVANLIDNSIKYGNIGGETKISFSDMDENILVEIADNGIGIAQEHIPRLFERFYRAEKSRSSDYGSTGLGLAIVKHILEAHQQHINVNSAIGIGTIFTFTLKKA